MGCTKELKHEHIIILFATCCLTEVLVYQYRKQKNLKIEYQFVQHPDHGEVTNEIPPPKSQKQLFTGLREILAAPSLHPQFYEQFLMAQGIFYTVILFTVQMCCLHALLNLVMGCTKELKHEHIIILFATCCLTEELMY